MVSLSLSISLSRVVMKQFKYELLTVLSCEGAVTFPTKIKQAILTVQGARALREFSDIPAKRERLVVPGAFHRVRH